MTFIHVHADSHQHIPTNFLSCCVDFDLVIVKGEPNYNILCYFMYPKVREDI